MRKSFSGNASITELTASITTSSTSLTVASGANYPAAGLIGAGAGGVAIGPFVIVVNRGEPNEEKILVGTHTTQGTFASLTRGYDGTAAQVHAAGSEVQHVLDSQTVEQANSHVNDTGQDHHTQYLNTGRHDTTARHPVGTVIPTGAVAPSAVGDVADDGKAASVSLSDHKHSRESFGSPTTAQTHTVTGASGSASTPARSDHNHSFGAPPTPPSIGAGVAGSAGTATTFAKGDHNHGVNVSGTPGTSAPGDAANSGTAAGLARVDHRHGRESFGMPIEQPSAQVPLEGSAPTLSRSDHRHSFNLANDLQISALNVGGGSSGGISNNFARGDHAHGLSTAAPIALGALSEGAATSVSRSDHRHPTTGLVLDTGTQTIAGLKTFSDPVTIKVPVAYGDDWVRRWLNVASLNSDSAVQTGAVLITTPITSGGSMTRLRIKGYLYSGAGKFIDLEVNTYTNSPSFTNRSYINYGDFDPGTVSVANLGTALVVIIGTTGDIWSYPKLWLEAMTGHSGGRVGWYYAGWSMEFRTDLSDLTNVTSVGKTRSLDVAAVESNANSRVLKSGDTMTGPLTIDGIAGSSVTGNSWHIRSANPQVRFEETDLAAGAAGTNYWFYQNAGNFFITQDRTGSGAWDAPSPFRIKTTGAIEFGFAPEVPANSFGAGQILTAAPVALGASASEGTGSWIARALHVHPTTGLVLDTGTQTVAGSKTFTSTLVVSGVTGNNAITGNSLHISTDVPQLKFTQNTRDASLGGRDYWLYHAGGSFFILQSRDTTGNWTSPHPFRVHPTGIIEFGFKPTVPVGSWNSADILTGTPTQQLISTAAEGSASSLARSDHTHSFATANPVAIVPGEATSPGTSTAFARADHRHNTMGVPKYKQGSYSGTGGSQTVNVGFTPSYVEIMNISSPGSPVRHWSNFTGTNIGQYVTSSGLFETGSNHYRPLLATNGFTVSTDGVDTKTLNYPSHIYFYIAHA